MKTENTSTPAKKTRSKKSLEQFKMEAANEVGVDLNDPNLRARDAGSVGGQMVKKMIEAYETPEEKNSN